MAETYHSSSDQVCRVGGAGGQVVAAQIAPTATGTEIICTMPSVPAPQELIVQHSLNGQQYVGHEITSQNLEPIWLPARYTPQRDQDAQ